MSALQNNYQVSTDWEGKNFCGLSLQWNYKEGYVDISMPTYILELLQKLLHQPHKYPQYSPHHYNPIVYGRKGQQQMATQCEDTVILNKQKPESYSQSLDLYSTT